MNGVHSEFMTTLVSGALQTGQETQVSTSEGL